MKCPYCKAELELQDNNAFTNADIYNNINNVLTACCDNPVAIVPIRSYKVIIGSLSNGVDDWGNEQGKIKPTNKEYTEWLRLSNKFGGVIP